jgi:hypothetical protein
MNNSALTQPLAPAPRESPSAPSLSLSVPDPVVTAPCGHVGERRLERTRLWPNEVVMRDLARRNAMKTKARKAQQPSYDPYASIGVDDSGGWVGPLPGDGDDRPAP